LLTANRNIMADANRVFTYLEQPSTRLPLLMACKTLVVSPTGMRKNLFQMIRKEIKHAKSGKPSGIIIKTNSLSDVQLIGELYEAAKAGVEIKMVIRGIFCLLSSNKKFKAPIQAISIVDEYLEHARVMVFTNNGNEKVFLSSADWMVRNIDHRVEVACPIFEKSIRQELIDILHIQLKDNIKARILDNDLSNQYVNPRNTKKIRSQVETYNYLYRKSLRQTVS